jgi:hypothetical protein
MKNILTILNLFFLIIIFGSCSSLFPPPDGEPHTEIAQYKSGDYGTVTTSTGEGLNIIPGVIPANSEGNEATITFTIETNVEDPGRLGEGATFKSALVKYGPEYFNFTWPVQLFIPYEDGQDPNLLSVLHFDYSIEDWVKLPKTGIDTEKKLVYFNSLSLGVFALAELTSDYRDYMDWCDGGFRFTDSNRDYYYTLTVASVTNIKYDWQQSILLQPCFSTTIPCGPVAGSTGQRNNSPLADTWVYLIQADYQIWISRTKPGTYWAPPVIETYSIPASGSLTEPNICPQSATTFPDLNLCSPWVDLTLPSGGTWVAGTPEGWAVPTITYGTGDFQATLNWINNESHATDLDLHLYGPDDMHVYYQFTSSPDGSVQLDRDWLQYYGNATENIYSLKDMPAGNYRVEVNLFSGHAANFNVRIINHGAVKNYSGSLQNVGDDVLIYEFTL